MSQNESASMMDRLQLDVKTSNEKLNMMDKLVKDTNDQLREQHIMRERAESNLHNTQQNMKELESQLSSLKEVLKESNERERKLERDIIEAEKKIANADSAGREAIMRRDVEAAKEEATLRQTFIEKESEYHREIAKIQGQLSACEFQKNAIESKLHSMEEITNSKIEDLKKSLKVEQENRVRLASSSISKELHSQQIQALEEKHTQDLAACVSRIESRMKD